MTPRDRVLKFRGRREFDRPPLYLWVSGHRAVEEDSHVRHGSAVNTERALPPALNESGV